jgi:hypothetical protein
MNYSKRHGGPFDRGTADSYYGRKRRPHFFKDGTYTSKEFHEENMTEQQVRAYNAGYEYNEKHGDKKNWD